MKQLISLTILFFISTSLDAQSEVETLEWLRTKQQTIRNASSDVIARRTGKLTIDKSAIRLSNAEVSTIILWSKVKDVTKSLNNITIVSSDLVDGKNAFIRLNIEGGILETLYLQS